MKRWIQFNIKNPKTVLSLLLIFTLLACYGITLLKFDNSTEALMPKYDESYQILERVKVIFGDNKTFLITSIKSADPEVALLSTPVFKQIQALVDELYEYHDFDKVKEDTRINTILKISNTSIEAQENSSVKKKVSSSENTSDAVEALLDEEILNGKDESSVQKTNPEANEEDDLEKELDAEILEGKTPVPKEESLNKDFDANIWNLKIPLSEDRYDKPIRKRNEYNYEYYKPVAIATIKKNLDKKASAQIDSVMRIVGIDSETQKLSQGQFEDFLETWEDLYLYKSLEILERIIDPITLEDIQGKTEGNEKVLDPVDLVKENEDNGERILPKSEADFKAYKKNLLKNPAFKYAVYSIDDKENITALGMVTTMRHQKHYDHFMDYYWEILKKYNHKPLSFYTMGNSVFVKFMTLFNKRDLSRFLPLVILVVLLTFYFNFRSLRGVILPITTVLLGTIWTMGAMGLAGMKLTMLGVILPPLLIAIGSSYSIHIFNQYMMDLEIIHREGKAKGLELAMTHISTTVLLAGITTLISFSTLGLNKIIALHEFGIIAALGTAFSVIVAVMLIPAVLMLTKTLEFKQEKGNDKHEDNTYIKKGISFLSQISIKYPQYVVAVMVISIIVSAFGITKLTTETSPSAYFKPDSYVRRASHVISSLFRGSMVINVVLDSGKNDGAKEPEFLRFSEDIRKWASLPEQKHINILHSTGYEDYVKRMHMAMNGDDSAFYKIPNKFSTVNDYMFIFNGDDDDQDGRIDALESVVDKEFRRINLMIRVGDSKTRMFGTDVSRAIYNKLNAYLKSKPNANHYTWKIVGEPINFVVMAKYIIQGQLQSLILSIIIVGFIIFLLFKNFRAGLVALIPLSVTITLVFGVMGFSGIPLDVGKAILSSIAIGIGVDDTIHFLNSYRKQLKLGLSVKEAIAATHRHAGLAIVYTSIALILGFSVLMLSSFGLIFDFGLLVSSVMAATTISALLFMPSIIVLFNVRVDKEHKGKFFDILNIGKFLGND